jgi:hypothetical protein
VFQDNFSIHVKKTSEQMRELMRGEVVEDRLFNNWLIPMSAYATLNEHIELPWDLQELIRMGTNLMIRQNKEMKKNDDLGNFWKIVQYLISSNQLFDGGDYKLEITREFNRKYFEQGTWKVQKFSFGEPTQLLFLTTSRLFNLYKSQALREGDKPLPDSTIDYYLRRTSHGSTLSRMVHSWVLARSDRARSWALFTEALQSDIADVQGGTTPEGIHLGAMAGTVDLVQRCFGGVEIRAISVNRSQGTSDLLKVQSGRLRGAEKLDGTHDRNVETLADEITRRDDLILPGSQSLNPVGTVFVGELPVHCRRPVSRRPVFLGDVVGVRHGHAEHEHRNPVAQATIV